MRRLQRKVCGVAARRERQRHFAWTLMEGLEEVFGTGEGFSGGEVLVLQGGLVGEEGGVGEGEAGPLLEDDVGGWAGPALELGFDRPGEGGEGVVLEDCVGDEGVDVFGVEEEAVHVEEEGADGGETGGNWF